MGEVSEERAGQLLDQLEAALRHERAYGIKRDGLSLSFNAGLFRLVTGWNVLVSIGSGVVSVEPDPSGVVRYRCSCLQLLIVTVVLATFMGLSTQDYGFAFAAFAWLFGGNA